MVRLIAAVLSAAFLAETAHAHSGHKQEKPQYHKKPAKPSHPKPSHDEHKPSHDKEDYDNTYPNNPRAPIGDLNTWFFFADWGHPDNVVYQRQIAFGMEQASKFLLKGRPDFIIAGGDNFYNAGVRNTSDPRWDIAWNNVYTYPSQQVPFYAVFGNHDYYTELPGPPGSIEGIADSSRTGSPEVEIDFYRQNALANRVDEAKAGFITGHNRWILPDIHYTRTYKIGKSGKTAEFIYFNTVLISAESGGITGNLNSPSSANYTGTAEIDWLENALRTSKADWKIPVGHYPLFSPSSVHGDNPDLILPLEPMFRRYGVKLYINGHDHIMSAVEYKGIKYYTDGAGGKSLYGEKFPYRPFYTEARELFSIQMYGFLQFTFANNAEQLKLVVHKAGNTTGDLTQYFPGQSGAVAWTDIINLKGHKTEQGYDDKDYAYTTSEKFEYKINSENPVQYKDPKEWEQMEVEEPPMEATQNVEDGLVEAEEAQEEESAHDDQEEGEDRRGRRGRVMRRLQAAQA